MHAVGWCGRCGLCRVSTDPYLWSSAQMLSQFIVMWCSDGANCENARDPTATLTRSSSPAKDGTAKKKTKSSEAGAKAKQCDTVLVCIVYKYFPQCKLRLLVHQVS